MFMKTLLYQDHFIDRLRPLSCAELYICLLLSTTEYSTKENLVLYGKCFGLAYTFLWVHV